MTDVLIELRSEEIPARMQGKAREDLARLFTAELAKAGLSAAELVTYATPRRLALIARGLPQGTQAVSEELKGPRTSAPPQALEGFLRKTGLTQDQLVDRDGVYFAVIEKPGRATADVLAEAIPAIVRAFPWPKSMRWGAQSLSTESLRWVRPLQGIVALFGSDVIDCEVAGVRSGAATVGHRFHHPGMITIGSADDYVEKLRACHVIVDQAERAGIIAMSATMLTANAGLTLIRDEGLLEENAGLTEWPVPLLGRFDEEYLSVPPEVIQLTARVNQKYFVCNGADGKLANAFVCVANIDASDGGDKIVEGNRKVLAARLSDARFFYETDLKTRLEDQLPKLEKIVFHEKLGTVADKVERVAKLARWLVEEGIVTDRAPAQAGAQGDEGQDNSGLPPAREHGTAALAAQAERAARLAKADLVTGMVGEFPELQGLMGGYYAAAQGEDEAVANAVRDHYKPVGQGDDVPTDPVTVAVSLADKLDTIAAFFAIDEKPTGSKDPFALRRAALGVANIVKSNSLRLSLVLVSLHALVRDAGEKITTEQSRNAAVLTNALEQLGPEAAMGALKAWIESGRVPSLEQQVRDAVLAEFRSALPVCAAIRDFFLDRIEVIERENGVSVGLIRASTAHDGGKEDDLVRLLARVHALQAFVQTEDGANLLAGYKRAANILKKEGWTAPAPTDADQAGDSQGVPETGEEDPLVLVEDPDFAAVVGELAEQRRAASLPYDGEPAELALIAALDRAEPLARVSIEREDFAGAMAALAGLRAPIDAFFDAVTVNDADPAKRRSRLALLGRMRDAVHAVADFSKIEG